MLHCCELIQKHRPKATLDQLESDEVLYAFFIRQLEVMGEAATRLSKEFRGQYPHIQWRQMIGMRNILIHGYDDLILEEIHGAIHTSVPTLEPLLRQIIDEP